MFLLDVGTGLEAAWEGEMTGELSPEEVANFVCLLFAPRGANFVCVSPFSPRDVNGVYPHLVGESVG